MKTCSSCRLIKDDEDFYFYHNRPTTRESRCKTCRCKAAVNRHKANRESVNKRVRNLRQQTGTARLYNRLKAKTLKRLSVEYLGGICMKCNNIYPDVAYDFHHINPATKEFEIAQRQSTNFEKLKPELDKCMLLCANCHRILHAELREREYNYG